MVLFPLKTWTLVSSWSVVWLDGADMQPILWMWLFGSTGLLFSTHLGSLAHFHNLKNLQSHILWLLAQWLGSAELSSKLGGPLAVEKQAHFHPPAHSWPYSLPVDDPQGMYVCIHMRARAMEGGAWASFHGQHQAYAGWMHRVERLSFVHLGNTVVYG